MSNALVGYAGCSGDKQDLAAQRGALIELGLDLKRIYTDHGRLTGTNRLRPGHDQALAAVRSGDTFVVPKLDRLARSVPDERHIADKRQQELCRMHDTGKYSISDLAELFSISRPTVYRTFARTEAALATIPVSPCNQLRRQKREVSQSRRYPGASEGQAGARLRSAHVPLYLRRLLWFVCTGETNGALDGAGPLGPTSHGSLVEVAQTVAIVWYAWWWSKITNTSSP